MNKIKTIVAALAGLTLGGGQVMPMSPSGRDRNHLGKLARIKRTEARQRSGSQYARDHAGEPGRNGGPKGV